MMLDGQETLRQHGFQQYEVSAYSQAGKQCLHNRNYWEFGDYLGIGAGAHSKITINNQITRFAQVRQPNSYLDAAKRNNLPIKLISEQELIFEFMLNALRLTDGVRTELFTKHTGLPLTRIAAMIAAAQAKGLLEKNNEFIRPSELGKRFLNDLVEMFLL
jgi:oxygen-independent coproporphyrinogen-3 oxidase